MVKQKNSKVKIYKNEIQKHMVKIRKLHGSGHSNQSFTDVLMIYLTEEMLTLNTNVILFERVNKLPSRKYGL